MIASKLQDFDLRILFYVSIFLILIILVLYNKYFRFYLLNIKTSIYNMDVLEMVHFFKPSDA